MTVAVTLSGTSYVRSANSGGVSQTATEIEKRLADRRLDSDFTKLAELAATPENPPSEAALNSANYYLHCLFARAFRLGSWSPPHITLSETGEIVFEWWHHKKKITIYFGEGNPEYLKVWGTDMDTEMDSGLLSDDWSLTSIWLWLHS